MKVLFILLVISVILVFTLMYVFGNQNSVETELSVQQVKEKIDGHEDIILLDVRTEAEFNGSLGRLPNAILIPVFELPQRLEELVDFREKEIIVYCRSGSRSRRATSLLREKNYLASNMSGGMLAWNRMITEMNVDSSEIEYETIAE